MATSVIQLRRMENSQPWGFRLKGGTDQGLPLHVEHIQPKGRAAQAGLMVGDYIVGISGVSTQCMTHGQVKSEMLRAGNDLDLTIQSMQEHGLILLFDAPEAGVIIGGEHTFEFLAKLPDTDVRQFNTKTDGSLTGIYQAPPVPQAAGASRAAEAEPRVVIDEQPICKLGGPTFKQVKPKTYQVLEGQLQNSDSDTGGNEPPVKPSSIFDRKRDERSDYLKAKGNTIQKAYGE